MVVHQGSAVRSEQSRKTRHSGNRSEAEALACFNGMMRLRMHFGLSNLDIAQALNHHDGFMKIGKEFIHQRKMYDTVPRSERGLALPVPATASPASLSRNPTSSCQASSSRAPAAHANAFLPRTTKAKRSADDKRATGMESIPLAGTKISSSDEGMTSPRAFLAGRSNTNSGSRMSFVATLLVDLGRSNKEVKLRFHRNQQTVWMTVRKGSALFNDMDFERYCQDRASVLLHDVRRGQRKGKACIVFDEISRLLTLKHVNSLDVEAFNKVLDEQVYGADTVSESSSVADPMTR